MEVKGDVTRCDEMFEPKKKITNRATGGETTKASVEFGVRSANVCDILRSHRRHVFLTFVSSDRTQSDFWRLCDCVESL